MADFRTAHDKTSRIEGGYSNNPLDRGGETIFGIARNRWPDWEGWALVDAFKQVAGFPENAENSPELIDMSVRFYKANFWDALRLDEVRSQVVADEIYDTHVNTGRAVIFLQEALNYIGRKVLAGEQLKVDGNIGSKTLAALHKYIKSDYYRALRLVKEMDFLQHLYYRQLTDNDPDMFQFYEGGWINQRVGNALAGVRGGMNA